jgi:nucleotide-binding universal stress UspA family protein
MYKKIMVPLDGSSLAESSLEQVKALANGQTIDEVDLVFVIQPLAEAATRALQACVPVDMDKVLSGCVKGYLDIMAKRLADEGIAVKSYILTGDPAAGIANFSAIINADLILMSMHDHTGPASWILGGEVGKGSYADSLAKFDVVCA